MRWCARCVLPDTRPGLTLDDEGVCSACRGHEDKVARIDWVAREAAFLEVVEEAKRRSTGYDCIVPISGGKDSWYQVITCQEHGLRVLGVTWRTPGRTSVGQRNLDALVGHLGIDHIDWTIDPGVERRFMMAAFEQKGATAIPMHMALFAIPTRLAVALRIPLVVWGENPQLEFGGSESARLATDLDLTWIRRYGVTNGTERQHWVGVEGLTERDLAAYALPAEEEFAAFAPRSIFLGSFFPWDSHRNAAIAAARGFESDMTHRRTGAWSFADIDCEFIAIHHYLKWYKFGFLRSFDNYSVDIRHGRLTRDGAIEKLRAEGNQPPEADIEAFCAFVGRDRAWFEATAERFRNHAIWSRRDGRWTIADFHIEDWPW